MKIYSAFTDADLEPHAGHFNIATLRDFSRELRYKPPFWMKAGLQETRTGYGGRLNSGYMIFFNGRWLRVYIMCYSNSGSAYIRSRGRLIFIS